MSAETSSFYSDLTDLRRLLSTTKRQALEALKRCLDGGRARSSPPTLWRSKPAPADKTQTLLAAIIALENSNFDDFSLLALAEIIQLSPLVGSDALSADNVGKADLPTQARYCLLHYLILQHRKLFFQSEASSDVYDLKALDHRVTAVANEISRSYGRSSWPFDLVEFHRQGALCYSAYRCFREFESLIRKGVLSESDRSGPIEEVGTAIETLIAAGSNVIAHLISNFYSRAQTFDVVNTVYWLCILCDGRVNVEERKARSHLLSLLLREGALRYLGGLDATAPAARVDDGSAAPSALFPGQLAWLIRNSDPTGDIVQLSLGHLREHARWLSDKLQDSHRTTPSYLERHSADQGHSAHELASFGPACAAWFFATQAWMLADEALNLEGRRILGIGQPVTDPKLKDIPYPLGMENFLKHSVIDKIRNGGSARQSAFFSMLLYGPPGTSKTTFAQKLALDLEWPLLEIGQNHFLAEGREYIERVADRIFGYLFDLHDVVVLFDEMEEMILERLDAADKESRMITASMLPRIKKLRDSKRTVFIFATNRPEKVDTAISRIGRFDIRKYVELPDKSQRLECVRRLVKKLPENHKRAKVSLNSFMADSKFAQITEYMSFGDLEHYVRRVTNVDVPNSDFSGDTAKTVFSQFVAPPAVKRMVKACKRMKPHDRPRDSTV
jgi:adenylate kinase family enzyme